MKINVLIKNKIKKDFWSQTSSKALVHVKLALFLRNSSKAHTAQKYYSQTDIFLAMKNYEASKWHSFFASLLRQLYSISCSLFYAWPFFTFIPRPWPVLEQEQTYGTRQGSCKSRV